jgi:hypothetical protein
MAPAKLTVACLDVGSVTRGNVGWAVLGSRRLHGDSLDDLVDNLIVDIRLQRKIALGFECPLHVPRRGEPEQLTKRRLGEIGVNWCGGPGGSVLATGLVQVRWVLGRLADEFPKMRGTTRVSEFRRKATQLLVWEAFVTKKAGRKISLGRFPRSRGRPHERDALVGALACRQRLKSSSVPSSDLEVEDSISLAGMHLVASGLAHDVRLLDEQCLVVMARKPV